MSGLLTPAIQPFVILGAVNLIAVMAMRIDKQAAIDGRRRISEGKLLLLAMVGGWPGMLWARRAMRHKTKKQPFSARLWTIVGVHLVAAGAWIASGQTLWPLP